MRAFSGSRAKRALGVSASVLISLAAALAHAQAPEIGARYVLTGAQGPQAEALTRAAETWLSQHAQAAQPITGAAQGSEPALSPEALSSLGEAEAALARARTLQSSLNERAALSVLSAAEARLRERLELPHAHAWLAELYVQMGLCAAQLGELGLSETMLMRAAALDPERRIQAAEAPPDLLALARRIERAREMAPRSHVPVALEPANASLFVDGRALPDQRSLDTVAGLHLLVARAPGHLPYASLVELGPGERAPLVIALSPDRLEEARQALANSAQDPARARPRAVAYSALSTSPVWVFEAGPPPLARALVYRCEATGCELTSTLSAGEPTRAGPAREPEARRWLVGLDQRSPPDVRVEPARPAWWSRWPVWASASALLVGAGVAAAWAVTRDPPTREQREVVIDPGTLP